MAQIPKTGTLYISDVRNALGESTTDLGRLCQSDKINQWAKYKPVRWPDPFPAPGSDWWKANDGNCGLSAPIFNNPSQAGNYNWDYSRPTGGSTAPFRLDDFRGYDDSSTPFIVHDYGSSLEINKQMYPSGVYTFFFSLSVFGGHSVSLEDISGLSDHYLTVQIISRTSSSGFGVVQSATKTVGQGGADIQIDINTIATGNYYLRFFFSSVRQDPAIGFVSANLLPFPHTDQVPAELSLSVVSQSLFHVAVDQISWATNGIFAEVADLHPQLGSTGLRLRTTGGVCFKCRAINTSSSAVSISPLSNVRIYGNTFHGTQELAYPTFYNSSLGAINSLAVPANSEVVFYIYSDNFLLRKNNDVVIPSGESPIACSVSFRQYSGSSYTVMGGETFLAVYGANGIVPDTWSSGLQ